jgi:hypothetical protein
MHLMPQRLSDTNIFLSRIEMLVWSKHTLFNSINITWAKGAIVLQDLSYRIGKVAYFLDGSNLL